MGKSALEAPRGTYFMLDPDELVIIEDPNHHLYDKRVEKPLTEAFIKNIMEYGVKKMIDGRKNGKLDNGRDRVEVVDGRRRVRGIREANKRRVAEGLDPYLIPVVLQKGSDADMDALMVLGNSNREDDDLITCAEKANRLIGLHGIDKTAVLFGKEVSTIEHWLKLLDLDDTVKEKVRSGEIAASAVYSLADIPREEQKVVLATLVADGGKTSTSVVGGAIERHNNPKLSANREKFKEARKKLLDVAWDWVEGSDTNLEDLKEAVEQFAAAKKALKASKKKTGRKPKVTTTES